MSSNYLVFTEKLSILTINNCIKVHIIKSVFVIGNILPKSSPLRLPRTHKTAV